MKEVNFQHIAFQIGDQLKYSIAVKDIDRVGQSILKISKQNFPNDSITSVRAQTLYSWVMSLASTHLESDIRIQRLMHFLMELTPSEHKENTINFLERNNCPYNILYKDSFDEFLKRNFHSEIIKHSQKLFIQGNFFHSVFEATKAYNKDVKTKSQSDRDGQPLMLNVWGCDGVLKVTTCQTQTEKDYQDGIKFISGGLMSAIRNPTAHEPANNWPIDKQDCLDILSLISFLYRQLEKATYFKNNG